MPSAGEQNYLTRDVDILVSGMKQNLKLSNLKEKPTSNRHHLHENRLAPYPKNRKLRLYEEMKVNNSNKNSNVDNDPYLKLCQLIKQGRLINEAVKKLQTINFEDLSNSDAVDDVVDYDEADDDDDDDFYRSYRRKRYYSYDSEDEPLPAVYKTLDL